MFRKGNSTDMCFNIQTQHSFNKALLFPPHRSCVFQQKGVIRVSGISLDYSKSELIKMASPFSHPVEVLMATEVDMETCLEWKKVCAILEYKLKFH